MSGLPVGYTESRFPGQVKANRTHSRLEVLEV